MITASSAMEYAFEGDELADTREQAPSVFTSALVEGLETGEADRDQDGLVALDELYDYVYDKVRAVTPNQTPGKWTFGVQGELVIARRSHPGDDAGAAAARAPGGRRQPLRRGPRRGRPRAGPPVAEPACRPGARRRLTLERLRCNTRTGPTPAPPPPARRVFMFARAVMGFRTLLPFMSST